MRKFQTVRFEVYIGDEEEPRYTANTHDEAADWVYEYEGKHIVEMGYDLGGDVYIREVSL